VTGTTVHASCVAIGGRGVLIRGASGSGKSDLALRLIDRGARLVSDDYTDLIAAAGRLVASPPATIKGRIEVRGVGIAEVASVAAVPVALVVDLDRRVERLPEPRAETLAGIDIPAIALAALEASAPIKLETALHLHGLSFA
jgi:serine kinase of HPr protein (carbohydrate metabolism regulator)